jgi:hypothetical protein
VLKIRAQDNETNKNANAISGLFAYGTVKINPFPVFIFSK